MIASFTLETRLRKRTIVKTYRKRADIKRAEDAVANSPHIYKWPDGSEAVIHVEKIGSRAARSIRRISPSLFGWEWMADTIVSHGKPLRLKDIQKEREACT